MSKDDFFVVIYQILSSRYEAVKRGDDNWTFTPEMLIKPINPKYFSYCLQQMVRDGLARAWRDGACDVETVHFQITSKGIEKLHEKGIMQTARDIVEGVRYFREHPEKLVGDSKWLYD